MSRSLPALALMMKPLKVFLFGAVLAVCLPIPAQTSSSSGTGAVWLHCKGESESSVNETTSLFEQIYVIEPSQSRVSRYFTDSKITRLSPHTVVVTDAMVSMTHKAVEDEDRQCPKHENDTISIDRRTLVLKRSLAIELKCRNREPTVLRSWSTATCELVAPMELTKNKF